MNIRIFGTRKCFDTKKLEEYAAQAKAGRGTTEAYWEYERKSEGGIDEAYCM